HRSVSGARRSVPQPDSHRKQHSASDPRASVRGRRVRSRATLMRRAFFAAGAAACVLAAHTSIARAGASAAASVFADATSAAGIRFRHTSGAFGKTYLPETKGSGAGFLDADG